MTMHPRWLPWSLTLAACGSSLQPMGPAGTAGDGLSADDGGVGSGGGSAVSGVPCEVAQLLSDYCVTCHKSPPISKVPMSLLSRADLLAEAPEGGTYAELSIKRMRDAAKPMPPVGSMPSGAAIDAFDAWVANGMLAGSCGDVSDPFAEPSTCTTKAYWRGGDEGSESMHPGVACISCHTKGVSHEGEIERGPRFSLAGTVFAGPHDPDDCHGVDGRSEGVVIEVTDARKRVIRITPNRVGNFYAEDSVSYPITARILYQGRVREMLTEQDSGDCNSCHSRDGDMDAPGRLLLP
jgi:mono/diheme cytochrome c family protein